jgi:hypothetical protein
MQKLVIVGVLAAAAACSTDPAGRAAKQSSRSDSAAVAALTAGTPFKLSAFSVTTFPDVSFRIAAALFQHDTIARLIVAAIDSTGAHTAYDSQIVITGCGDPEPDLPTINRYRIGKRLLLRVQVRRSELGCSSVATTDFRSVHLIDTGHDFREVLTYQSDSLDYGNPEDGVPRAVTYWHTYDYPNVCISSCDVLSMISISSSRQFRQRVFSYRWNADSTALVPNRR